jgi:hypothetical protein
MHESQSILQEEAGPFEKRSQMWILMAMGILIIMSCVKRSRCTLLFVEKNAVYKLTLQNFQAFNIVVSEDECHALFVSLGANEKGWIEYNEFRRAVEEASAAW